MRKTIKLMKDTQELNKCRDIPLSRIGRECCQDVSSSYLIYTINASLCKLFHGYEQTDSKVHIEGKRPNKANSILKNNKVWGLTLPDFKTDYKVTVINTVWYRQKNSQTDQWNRMQSPDIDPHEYSYLTLTKSKGNSVEKGQSFQ